MKRMAFLFKLAVLVLLVSPRSEAQFGYEYNSSFLKAWQAEFYASLSEQEKKAYQDFKTTVGILVLEDSARVRSLGFKISRSYNFAGKKWHELPREQNNDATVEYLRSKGIESFNLEYSIVKTQAIAADSIPAYLPYPERKWGLKSIGFFDKAIVDLRTSENDPAQSTIFVLGTGGPSDSLGAIDHPYFLARGKVRLGGNYVPRPDSLYWHWDWTVPPRDRHGHETHVGGIIADINRSDSLVFIKTLRAGGFGLYIWAQAGIQEVTDYAIETGLPVVVNGSWGGGPWAPIEYQLKYIDSLIVHERLKISLVFAAGNTASQLVIWPAAYGHRGYIPGYENGYPFMIAVGALEPGPGGSVRKAPYSAYDRDVDVFAPGGGPAFHDSALTALDGKYFRFDSTSVLSTAPIAQHVLDWIPRYYRDPRDSSTVDPLYRYLSGTSMAAPHIAGTVAWFLGRYPDFPVSELRERLKNTGISFAFRGLDSVYTYEGRYLYLPYLFGVRFNVKILSYAPQALTDTVGVGTKIAFRIDSVATKSTSPIQFRWTHNNAVVSDKNSTEIVFYDPGRHTITGIVSAGGDMDFVSWLIFVDVTTGVDDNPSIPKVFTLHQNYPNPFNPRTVISYDLPKESLVRITVYDLLGREVKVLVSEVQSAGFYRVRFEAGSLSSGIYFYRLVAGEFIETKKFVILK